MKCILVAKLVILFFTCGCAQSSYTNPVYAEDFADPTLMRGHDGWFYAYGTNTLVGGKLSNIQVAKSQDLVNWKFVADALPVKPAWADKDFWAPHVLYDGKRRQYYLYYSGESPDSVIGKCIGVATSRKPEGPFRDIGHPLISGEGFVNIDPMAFDDPVSGRKFLYWGSGHQPIKVQELDDDRISFKAGSRPREVLAPGIEEYSRLVEGAWLHYANGYYYLFYSGDNCCGENANYAVMIARAKSPEGPFETLGETRKTNRSTILHKNERWLAPGHNSIVTDDANQDWIVYHGISLDGSLRSKGRIMLIDRLLYKDGWPLITTSSPSTEPSIAPLIINKNSK